MRQGTWNDTTVSSSLSKDPGAQRNTEEVDFLKSEMLWALGKTAFLKRSWLAWTPEGCLQRLSSAEGAGHFASTEDNKF